MQLRQAKVSRRGCLPKGLSGLSDRPFGLQQAFTHMPDTSVDPTFGE